ncbi:MAG: M20 family metallo-hydrolase [Prevotella sp.]|nr:M20 family metallo-hydrolase [Prevotella sp.]
MPNNYSESAVSLLRKLIATPSVSREEGAAADLLESALSSANLSPRREKNNVWSIAPDYDPSRPTLLLNAHVDTVRPVSSWTRSPFSADIEGDRLYGLGSNDCGGGLVSLLQVFIHLSGTRQPYNLVYLASAEEEVSGANGLSHALPLLPRIDMALVGEPTGMQPAVAEKGLMVVDMVAHGKSGHAARGEGVNALYLMLDDLLWLREHRFEKVSPLLGPTLLNVTVLNAGTQHNVVPDTCTAVIDVRTNELYTNEEVFDIIRTHVRSEVKARSFRLKSSSISLDHPVVRRCVAMGKQPFGSPTLSDQALMPFPSLKMGPGESSRSHSADEFICLHEIEDAIEQYICLLDGVKLDGCYPECSEKSE